MARLKLEEINDANREMALLIRRYVGYDAYKDVAADVGVDPSCLSLLCRGKVKPTIETLYKLGQRPRNGVYFEDFMKVRFPLAVMKGD